jgi:L-Lysine epsilon oxidase N-terminal/L-lysine epsilon oxidase C-terminal domain
MTTVYKIHPGIGIARLGNSPEEFCISPEEPAALPIDCDARGNPRLSADGKSPLRIDRFKDALRRIKRQAARFQVFAYDDQCPEGRPLRLGDWIEGGGNAGELVDIQWRVHLANKKASWYEFRQLQGEHGYAEDHPRRNARVTAPEARQRLIIDPGPRVVDCHERRTARFDRDGGDLYAPTFPPPLEPAAIDTLGELETDDAGRLLVLGGRGHSGSFELDAFGQPRIDDYANNDGWFDDTSDGPVTARLVMRSPLVEQVRFVDVEDPAWVIVGYPAYVPQILDMVTMDEVLHDLAVREFAARTDLYGEAGTFDDPQRIDPTDTEALVLWKAGRLQWNPDYRPWFWRDIWPILFRADEFLYLTNVLGQSNFPHNQSGRGNFDPDKLSVPPVVDRRKLAACEQACIAANESGELFVETLAPVLALAGKQAGGELSGELPRARAAAPGKPETRMEELAGGLRQAVAEFAREAGGEAPREARRKAPRAARREAPRAAAGAAVGERAGEAVEEAPGDDYRRYLARWRSGGEGSPAYPRAQEQLEQRVEAIVEGLGARTGGRRGGGLRGAAAKAAGGAPALGEPGSGAPGAGAGGLQARLRTATREHLRKYHSGQLLEQRRAKCLEAATEDVYKDSRQYLFDLLRRPGEENVFRLEDRPTSRVHGLPLMPLLAGDNPLNNTLPAKFFRLTDFQYYLLRQWALGLFYNEELEGWGKADPWRPYAGWVNRTGHDLDRGVLSNLLGGAFCPGGEAGWILRNPAIYREPYRLKADPAFASFRQTAAQANASRGQLPEADYAAYVAEPLSQDNDFDRGLQPGDVTKAMALPWQADFNECTTQDINVTYEEWNQIDPTSDHDSLMRREERVWETLWWPAHRPVQTFEIVAQEGGKPVYRQVDWSRGIPGTNAGSLKMVSDWWRLGFVARNPSLPPGGDQPSDVPPPDPPVYIDVERGERSGPAERAEKRAEKKVRGKPGRAGRA